MNGDRVDLSASPGPAVNGGANTAEAGTPVNGSVGKGAVSGMGALLIFIARSPTGLFKTTADARAFGE